MGPGPLLSIYLDTSFIVSFYSVDANSRAASRIVEAQQSVAEFVLTTFSELEVVNALQLRLFRKQNSSAQIGLGLRALDEDLRANRLQLKSLPDHAFQRARELSLQTTAQFGTRSSDLLHVACALELGATGFYSFDKQQRRLAESLRLTVNP